MIVVQSSFNTALQLLDTENERFSNKPKMNPNQNCLLRIIQLQGTENRSEIDLRICKLSEKSEIFK